MIAALRACIPMVVGAILLAGFLLVVGVPGAVLLAIGPVAVCVAMVIFMDHSDEQARGAKRHVDALRDRR